MEKSKLIVLWGRGSIGKTSTLRKLINTLLDAGAVQLSGSPSDEGKGDCWAVLEYKGRRIAVITAGDSANDLEWYFKKVTVVCDVYICASRSRGGTCKYLEERFAGHDIMWQAKWSITQQSNDTKILDMLRSQANQAQAAGLLAAIESL